MHGRQQKTICKEGRQISNQQRQTQAQGSGMWCWAAWEGGGPLSPRACLSMRQAYCMPFDAGRCCRHPPEPGCMAAWSTSWRRWACVSRNAPQTATASSAPCLTSCRHGSRLGLGWLPPLAFSAASEAHLPPARARVQSAAPPAAAPPLPVQGDESAHAQLRQRVAEFLEEREEEFQWFVEDDQGFRNYTRRMRKARHAWGAPGGGARAEGGGGGVCTLNA